MATAKHKVVWLDRGWQPVFIGFCPSEKAWHREMKRMSVSEPYPSSSGCTTRFKTGDDRDCIIVCVHERLKAGSCRHGIIGLIVHECTHAWRFILDTIGEDVPSSEFEAYSMQAITQQVTTAFCDTRFNLFSKKPKQ
ncbi:hypothetical protein [Pseudomonas sp. BGI-2]|uniref:hypothetical protein n=1 Tax=Pseudomonas sp. BGI-2 TaxID=2528211 RepID=UPI0010348CAC|nr:hypothetical protein [Pseudomonas sp. BGI-2]TBN49170.1 hypothetical protein EYC95_06420 [Pseudomonas sp. BGI-2]